MRKNGIAILLVLMLAGWGIYDYTQDGSEPTNSPQQLTEPADIGIQEGNLAPDFQLQTMNGETVKLSDFKGKKVILNFWATWCPPCRAEMPHLEKFYEDHQENVVVLAVNLTKTEKKPNEVKAFVEEFGLTFPTVMDIKGEVSDMYQIFAYPTSYMVDSQGIIQEIFKGAINYEVMEKSISRIN